MDKITSKINAEHYTWGDNCDGWHLLKRTDISIIQEQMPPGKYEAKHYHKFSRQFFFILSGEANMIFEDGNTILHKQQGIEIPPGIIHQIRNDSNSDLSFLVISSPKSHGDRIIVE
jgi:mannose-6-phosphate isomerase-like protein (cupin superfamily)